MESRKEWDDIFAERQPFSNSKLCFFMYFTLRQHGKLSTRLDTLQSLGKFVFTLSLLLLYFHYKHTMLLSYLRSQTVCFSYSHLCPVMIVTILVQSRWRRSRGLNAKRLPKRHRKVYAVCTLLFTVLARFSSVLLLFLYTETAFFVQREESQYHGLSPCRTELCSPVCVQRTF